MSLPRNLYADYVNMITNPRTYCIILGSCKIISVVSNWVVKTPAKCNIKTIIFIEEAII